MDCRVKPGNDGGWVNQKGRWYLRRKFRLVRSRPSHGQGPVPAYYRLPNEKHEIREDAMSRTLRTALFVAAVAAVSAIAPSTRAQEAVTLHGAVQFNDDHAFNKALLRFEQLVKHITASRSTSCSTATASSGW